MKKWNFLIDIAECEDCNNCFLACKDEHVDNDFPNYSAPQPRHGHRWMNIMRRTRGSGSLIDVAYRPTPCMHCDLAPCVSNAKGAVYKREDGIVIIDPVKAKGRRDILDSCPYGAVWWNNEQGIPQKCGFCAHLLDSGWKQPRCTQVCPTGALRVLRVEDSEMEQLAASEHLQVLHPEYNTKPRVYYKNLYRYSRCFIGGSVAITKNGLKNCAEGANVVLEKDGVNIAEFVTDNYGDFKFDNLERNSGQYKLTIKYNDYAPKIFSMVLETSVNIGDIYL
jgi:Fe-S-cluster-containing dehydrogenase component